MKAFFELHTTNNLTSAVLVVFLVLVLITLRAQGQSNSWIGYGQEYYKISIGSEGMFRVNFEDLRSAGFPGGIAHANLKLYHRGEEQAVSVGGNADALFGVSDFIEFYGKPADGELDAKMYGVTSAQPHTYYSIYNDTSHYFLTYSAGAGKRITKVNASGSSPPELFHWDQKLLVLKEQFATGVDLGSIQQSTFDEGEGWMGNQILQGQSASYTIAGIATPYTAGPKPELEIQLTGRGIMNHAVQISVGSRQLASLSIDGFKSVIHAQPIEWTDISAGQIIITVNVSGVGGQPARASVNYIRVKYPQGFNLQNQAQKILRLPENPTGNSTLQIANYKPGTRLFNITSSKNVIEVAASETLTLNAQVSATTTEIKILATTPVRTSLIKRVRFRQIPTGTNSFVIITHQSLRRPVLGYTDPVKAYGEYRSSPQGGAYDTLIVNIQQLYDQFNYGEQSPLAVFEFLKFLKTKKLPSYLLFIGKGLAPYYNYHRNPQAFTVYKDLVPTAGYPGSDALYTAFDQTSTAHAVATGRLSVTSAAEVAHYLNKVKETEARSFDDLRRKTILHISGGIEEYQLEQFRLIMKEFQAVGESNYLGADVIAVSKQSTDIQLVNIADELNKGLGFITFFGHSAPGTTDFDIGYVTNPIYGYDNKGKYPMLLLNGCSAGDAFLDFEITGENWINAQNKGLSAFIANSNYGFVHALRNYTNIFYQTAFGDSLYVTKGIGDIHREVAKRYLEQFGTGAVNLAQAQQMVLLGDPALKIFGIDKPDYELSNPVITSFNENQVLASMDSFRLSFVIKNYGLAFKQKYRIEVSRTLSDNSQEVYGNIFEPVLNSDTLTFTIKNSDASRSSGKNVFTIRVDPDDLIDELREDNNTVTLNYIVPFSTTKHLYPTPFGIVKQRDVVLSFQMTDLLSGEKEFILELDTTSTFNSPVRQTFTVKGKVLVSRSVKLLVRDSTAYFWRTKLASPAEDESKEWTMSSFTFIENGPEGWTQITFNQFYQNPSSGLVKDAQLKQLVFERNTTDVWVKTFAASEGKPPDSVSIKVANTQYNISAEGAGCRNNTLNLVAFDKKSTRPYVGLYYKWYEPGRRFMCGREPYAINSFTVSELISSTENDLVDYINNIALGDSVVLFTIGDADFRNWPAEAKSKLAELGIASSQLDQVLPGSALIAFTKKGSVAGSARLFHDAANPALEVKGTVSGGFDAGEMTTAMIGPASRWQRLTTDHRTNEPADDVSYDLMGVSPSGSQTLLKSFAEVQDMDLSWIDHNQYPYLRIIFRAKDSQYLTSPQLTKWLVIFEPMPEGILIYKGTGETRQVEEGERWKEKYAFVNVGQRSFNDSLSVSLKVSNRNVTSERSIVIKPPAPGDTTSFEVDFPTTGLSGTNDVEVFVNPFLEIEQYYDNNVINILGLFQVIPDQLRPVFDVTFDDRYLRNEEFISASPTIRVILWDENKYLLKTDTVGMDLFLAAPCETDACAFKRISFSGSDVKWSAATDTSHFTMWFRPKDLTPGTYTLRVNGKDVAGNIAAAEPYEIRFIVSSDDSFVLSPPFPNPSGSKVYFEFTVSGQSAPQALSLEVMNSKGTIVRSVFQDEKNMRVGYNTFVFDGAGDSGAALPAGIYFYRLSINANDMVYRKAGKFVMLR